MILDFFFFWTTEQIPTTVESASLQWQHHNILKGGLVEVTDNPLEFGTSSPVVIILMSLAEFFAKFPRSPGLEFSFEEIELRFKNELFPSFFGW
jgi:hypothetical protein